ncbi:MAG: tryptophan 7-halogenase [Gammaproteobacteria bacterium]|nr:tryptophan 7-halogenase [Gammaproteobacteria bacterium]
MQKNIIIVGGGTAGWMAAAALSNALNPQYFNITLVESKRIGTVGVGEATIPGIIEFNKSLNIDENDFIKKTNATFKLGIEFIDWTRRGDSYIHPFSFFGQSIQGVNFHDFLTRIGKINDKEEMGQYSLGYMAARNGKFKIPSQDPRDIESTYFYAYHFDASLYADYLENYSVNKGVIKKEGMVTNVNLHSDTGFIESITMEKGEIIEGDLFIDCTGFKSLLIGETLGSEFVDWKKWLPCDRAVAIQSELTAETPPYTKAIAHEYGWQWQIPLHHRMGNGYVYCSDYLEANEAEQHLKKHISGKLTSEPNHIKFRTGKREKSWVKNCVAVGLSSGFLEPLESTSIHLIQTSVMKLIKYFPANGISKELVHQYNQEMNIQFDQVKDFLILHYKTSQRDDSEFWNYCRRIDIPDSLKERMELFQATGQFHERDYELFLKDNWLAVLIGQGVYPQSYDKRLDQFKDQDIAYLLAALKGQIQQKVSTMPSHKEILQRFYSS